MEQNSSNDTVSSQKSLPSSYDSGWNDPPEWALSLQHNSSKTKKLLNKRVAFPLSSQTSTAEIVSSSPPSNTPPILQSSMAPTITTAPHKPLVAPMDKEFTTKTLDSDFDQDQALTEVLANLKSVMTEQKMEMNMIEEIEKRLDIMETDWRENKLNNMIHRSVLDISKALLRKDTEQANKIHIALMTQHVTACRTWIPAIRHIIFKLKKENENSNVSQPEQSSLLSVELKKKKSMRTKKLISIRYHGVKRHRSTALKFFKRLSTMTVGIYTLSGSQSTYRQRLALDIKDRVKRVK